MSKPNIVEAMSDRRLFEPWFRGRSWDGWKAMLKAAHGIPMQPEEIKLLHKLAERDPPKRQVREFWVCGGRRLGKDSIASLSVGHSAAFFDGGKKLRRGERARFLSLACSRDQSRIALEYTRSYYTEIKPLAGMVSRTTRDGLELSNSTEIVIGTNDYRGVRGSAIARCILSECAFYKSEDLAAPDIETYRAIMPAMSTIDGAMLIGISSPHAKSGLLYQKFCEHYGRNDDDVLFIRAPTIELNPTIDRRIIEKALADDFDAASAEWNAVFREGVSGLIGSEAIRRVIVPGRTVLQPDREQTYVCFVDGASGVAGGDFFCAAWAHFDKSRDRAILDQVYERRPPFNADDCVPAYSSRPASTGMRRPASELQQVAVPNRRRFQLVWLNLPHAQMHRPLPVTTSHGRSSGPDQAETGWPNATRTLTTTVGPASAGLFIFEIQAFSRVLPGVEPVLIRHGSGARFFQKGKDCQ